MILQNISVFLVAAIHSCRSELLSAPDRVAHEHAEVRLSDDEREEWSAAGTCNKECRRNDCNVACESYSPMVTCLGYRCSCRAVGAYAYSFCNFGNCTASSEGLSSYSGCNGIRCRASVSMVTHPG